MDQGTRNLVLEMFQQLVSSHVPSSSQVPATVSGPTAATADSCADLGRSRSSDTADGVSDENSSDADGLPLIPQVIHTAEDYLSTKHNPAKKIFKV